MDIIFWYFVKEVRTGELRRNPLCYETYIGDIGDHLFYCGTEYEILDWVKENTYWTDLVCE